MKTLFDTNQRFNTLSLPFVRSHGLGEKALQWYIDCYGELAMRELFDTLCLRDPVLCGSICRLFLTSDADHDAYVAFAQSLGLTTEQLDALFDPQTYRHQSA